MPEDLFAIGDLRPGRPPETKKADVGDGKPIGERGAQPAPSGGRAIGGEAGQPIGQGPITGGPIAGGPTGGIVTPFVGAGPIGAQGIAGVSIEAPGLYTAGTPVGGPASIFNIGGAPIAILGGVFTDGLPIGGPVGQIFRSTGPVPNTLFISTLESSGPIGVFLLGGGGVPLGAVGELGIPIGTLREAGRPIGPAEREVFVGIGVGEGGQRLAVGGGGQPINPFGQGLGGGGESIGRDS